MEKSFLSDEDLEEINKIINFGKYLSRASQLWEIYDKQSNRKKSGNYDLLLLSNALLFVCIEVYKYYKFSDEKIDYLLSTKFEDSISLLRKFRNTIFHPGKQIPYDNRQLEYFQASQHMMPWTLLLLFEFERYVYFFGDQYSYRIQEITIEYELRKLGNIYRRMIKDILEWLPNRSIYIKMYKNIYKLKNIYNYKFKNEPHREKELKGELDYEIKSIEKTVDELYKKLNNMSNKM